MQKISYIFLLLTVLLAACTESVSNDQPARILTMGDSMLAVHDASDGSVSDAMESILNEPVIDRSVLGARVFYNLPISGALGMNISQQYRAGSWDWVVMNGGGNDLWLGCACSWCDRKINRMIAKDGSQGGIVDTVLEIRKTGAQVIYVGYLRSPGVGSLIEHCKDEGDELEARLARLAARDPGVHFVSLKDLVPQGDRSYHSADMIHPSIKGSHAIAERVASIIKSAPRPVAVPSAPFVQASSSPLQQ